MNLKIPENIYSGCGKCWVAINRADEVVAIRYMDRCPLASITETLAAARRVRWCKRANNVERELNATRFAEYRKTCRNELAKLGNIVTGMASCGQFIA